MGRWLRIQREVAIVAGQKERGGDQQERPQHHERMVDFSGTAHAPWSFVTPLIKENAHARVRLHAEPEVKLP